MTSMMVMMTMMMMDGGSLDEPLEAAWGPAWLAALLGGLLVMAVVLRRREAKPGVLLPLPGDEEGRVVRVPVQRWVPLRSQDARRGGAPWTIVMLAYGTRGDVQPLLALGRRLVERGGVKVVVCAPGCYRGFVEQEGLVFRHAGVDKVAQPPEGANGDAAASIADMLHMLVQDGLYATLGDNMWAASEGCDAIIGTALTRSISMHLAEKRGVPCVCAHFVASDVSTKAFPPPDKLAASARFAQFPCFVRGAVNQILYAARGLEIVRAAVSTGLAREDAALRARVGLPPADPLRGLREVQEQPSLHAYSQEVQPRPGDWPDNVVVTGYWRLQPRAGGLGPDAASQLASFFRAADEAGERVLFLTLGSMLGVEELLVRAARVGLGLGLRVLIGDLRGCEPSTALRAVETEGAGRVWRCTSPLPHEDVFPRCACVVHHGGAGTTAAALFSGTPSVVAPHFLWSDQPYWGSRVTALGVGVRAHHPCSTAELRQAVESCLEPEMRDRAATLAARLADEPDGARVAADWLLAYLKGVLEGSLSEHAVATEPAAGS